MNILLVSKQDVPYSVDIRIAGTTFTFTFNYNSQGDFFTVGLERNGDVLVYGEKIVYGKPLFMSSFDERFPQRPVIPLDRAMSKEYVGWRELENDVFLFVPEVENG